MEILSIALSIVQIILDVILIVALLKHWKEISE